MVYVVIYIVMAVTPTAYTQLLEMFAVLTVYAIYKNRKVGISGK